MSKRPKSKALVDSDSDASEEEVQDKSPKKQKSTSSVDNAKQDDGSYIFPLAKKRQVSVRDFRGKVYVDIREFYEDKEGDMKPGKKGISLPIDQWEKLKEVMDNVDAAVSTF